MSTEDERTAQRAAWKQALTAAAKAQRQRRGKRAAGTRVRAGMNRITPGDQLNPPKEIVMNAINGDEDNGS